MRILAINPARRIGWARSLPWIGLGIFIFLAGTLFLERVPSLWWDEGWTLSVARNWIELGHYGQILDGAPRSSGLAASLPVIAPVALSFKLLGVGVWQGRLPGVLFTFAALALVFLLARRLYPRPVAAAALVILMLLPVNEKLHPLLIGRQVLGEMPLLFYLLAGYALFLLALDRSSWFLLPAVLLWAVALNTKAQVPPFWLASLLLPLLVALYKGWWRAFFLLGLGLAGSWLGSEKLLPWLWSFVPSLPVAAEPALAGYYEMSAVVPALHIRLEAWLSAVAFGLPTMAGLGAAAWRSLREIRNPTQDPHREILKLALLGLAGSWLVWYLVLAMYWPRYLFPVLFVGSIFTAALLYDLSSHFDLRATVRQASSALMLKQINRKTIGAVAGILLAAHLLAIFGLVFSISAPTLSDTSVEQAASYLDRHTPADALVESYDIQVFFLAHRRYHYPPDQVHVQLNKRTLLDPATPVDYDPLAADPDYLVVGPSSSEWRLYDAVLATGAFRLVYDVPRYQIYERLRP